jgi:hypothetical protein
MLLLDRLSFGVGDRFAHQAKAQLRAFQRLAADGVHVTPVWNKSNREHLLIGSEPSSVRAAAAEAVRALHWDRAWHVDADHIRLESLDRFLDSSDFFTIDVADSIGKSAAAGAVEAFVERHAELVGRLNLPGVSTPFTTTAADIERAAAHYLLAVQEAGAIYRRIDTAKGNSGFIAEASMDETHAPQSPLELLVILAALADEGVRVQTIAPKFTGRFNKGVDYDGDARQFEREFRDDVAVIAHAVGCYGLPSNLKLSVHSGSDKFSLYPIIHRVLAETGAGIHVKTAGTTWLEELIGLAESGGDGLALAKDIYAAALAHVDELCAPYAAVVAIDRARLPSAPAVGRWTGQDYAAALRHQPGHPAFNPHLRQLLHVAFKLAAKTGVRYTNLLTQCEANVARNVTENLYQRHLRPLFVG